MPYSQRPNIAYRPPVSQGTTIARLNMELGQLVQQKKASEAFAMAARIKEQGVKPNHYTYELLLELCKDAALPAEAMAIVEDMFANDILPQRQVFHLLLQVM